MPSNHLILCHPFLLPSIFPSIRVFSNESAFCIKCPKYWKFSFSISPSNEYSGLISFKIDWLIGINKNNFLKSDNFQNPSVMFIKTFFISWTFLIKWYQNFCYYGEESWQMELELPLWKRSGRRAKRLWAETPTPETVFQGRNLQVKTIRNCLRAISLVLISHLVTQFNFFMFIFSFSLT